MKQLENMVISEDKCISIQIDNAEGQEQKVRYEQFRGGLF